MSLLPDWVKNRIKFATWNDWMTAGALVFALISAVYVTRDIWLPLTKVSADHDLLMTQTTQLSTVVTNQNTLNTKVDTNTTELSTQIGGVKDEVDKMYSLLGGNPREVHPTATAARSQ